MLIACMLSLGLCAGGAAASAETVDYVQAAMDAADRLYGSYMLAGDGSVITVRETSYQGAAAGYAQLEGVKKLCVSPSEFRTFALTESGDLYAGAGVIASGVVDLVFCTTNSNEEGYVITDGGIRRFGGDQMYDMDYTDEFVRLTGGGKVSVVSPARIGADKHCFFVLDENGFLFMDQSSSYFEACGELGIFDWENLALAGVAINTSDPRTLTAAGIRKDGTVVAAGDYAEEILSWGPLSWISMGGGTIVGLTRDGSLKVTGQAADLIRDIVEGWSGVVAVKVGRHARLGDLVTAVDADGDFYCVYVDHNAVQGAGKISLESGSATDMICFRYVPDGAVYRSRDGSGWTIAD